MDQTTLKLLLEEVLKKALSDVVRKDDLKNFITKDDAKSFAKKDDLKNFITKDFLDKKLNAIEIKFESKLENKLEIVKNELLDEIRKVDRMQEYSFEALESVKEDRAAVKKLEKRVDKLESTVFS